MKISRWRTSTERAADKSVTRLWTDRAGVAAVLVLLVAEVIAIAGDRLGMSYHTRSAWVYPLLAIGMSTVIASYVSGLMDNRRRQRKMAAAKDEMKTDGDEW